MNSHGEHDKSKSVLLCRSNKDPTAHGKEIQGLVFDHPSMPKILTVSSAVRKTSSSDQAGYKAPTTGNRVPTIGYQVPVTVHQAPINGNQVPITRHQVLNMASGHRAREQYSGASEPNYPTGQKALQHYPFRPREQLPTGTPQSTNGHYTPTRHPVPAQYPYRKSPPTLVRTPQQSHHIPGPDGFGQFYHRSPPNRAKPTERIVEAPENHANKSQICFPANYRPTIAPLNVVLPSTTPPKQYNKPQHGHFHANTQESITRRNSTGALSHLKHGIQYSEDGFENSTTQRSERVETTETEDRFSRDFHLGVWRSSYERASSSFKPPVRRQDRLVGLQHVMESAPKRSLQTNANNPPNLIFRGEDVPYRYEHPKLPGSPPFTNLSPSSDIRRYNTGRNPGLAYVELRSTTGQNAPEACNSRDFNLEVRSAEETAFQVLNINNSRRTSEVEENNPVVRNAENNESSSSFDDDYNSVVQNAGRKVEGRNSEASNSGSIRRWSHTTEDENNKSNRAEGRKINVSKAEILDEFERTNPTECKHKHAKTVVVISDSDDEEMNNPSPLSSYDSDQEVFIVTPKTKPNDQANVPQKSESTCYITKVKEPSDNGKQLENESADHELKSTGPSKESQVRDVKKDEEQGVGMNYRSVLYERETPAQSSAQRVMCEQLFHKEARGTKRSLSDKAAFTGFTAGPAEYADQSLDVAAKNIRRVSCAEFRDEKRKSLNGVNLSANKACNQSFPDQRGRVHSEGNSNHSRYYEDMPKLVRSHSEKAVKEKTEQKPKINCSSQLMYGATPSNSEVSHTNDNRVLKSESQKVRQNDSCNLQSRIASIKKSVLHCDLCLNQDTSVIRETASNKFRCHSCDRVLIKKPGIEESQSIVQLPKRSSKPTGIVVGVKQAPDMKQPLGAKTTDPKKPTKHSGIKFTNDVIKEDNEAICDDQKSVKKVGDSNDLDILYFEVVKKNVDITRRDAQEQVKSTSFSHEQILRSQQWEVYSLKLEQEDKSSCGEKCEDVASVQGVVKRNSWKELKRKFEEEQKTDNITCSDISFKEIRCNTTLRRAYSADNELQAEYESQILREVRSPDHLKRRKLSNVNEKNILKSCNSINSQRESPPAEQMNPEIKTSEENTSAVRPLEVLPSDVRPLDINTEEKDSAETETPPKRSPELEFTKEISSVNKAQRENSLSQKEELSLDDWIAILEGRIAQVKESIEEETAPWKNKNKKKVLEKLENHLVWMIGPEVNEAVFVAKKLQFFQTVRKQYELMDKIKSQRQTMKSTDCSLQIVENVDKPKSKGAKEVGLSNEKTQKVKRTTKCGLKSVKKSGRGLMKKIRKAVLS